MNTLMVFFFQKQGIFSQFSKKGRVDLPPSPLPRTDISIIFWCLIALRLVYSLNNLVGLLFLHFGITLAILDIGGKIPVIQDIFIINESAIESSFINCFKRKVVTLLGPTALLIVVLLMLFCISFSFTWWRNKEFRFLFFRYSVIFYFDFSALLSILLAIFANYSISFMVIYFA